MGSGEFASVSTADTSFESSSRSVLDGGLRV
jgi:hypothetical protein